MDPIYWEEFLDLLGDNPNEVLGNMNAEQFKSWKTGANNFIKNNMPDYEFGWHEGPQISKNRKSDLYMHDSPSNNWGEYYDDVNKPSRSLALYKKSDLIPQATGPIGIHQPNISQKAINPSKLYWYSDAGNPYQHYPESQTGRGVAKTVRGKGLDELLSFPERFTNITSGGTPEYSSVKEEIASAIHGKTPDQIPSANKPWLSKLIKAGLVTLGTFGTYIVHAAPGLDPIDIAGRAGEATGLGYGKTALGATGALAAAYKLAPQVAKSIVNVGAKIAAPLAALDIGMGMSNTTKDQMQKAGPRDRSAIAYSQNTGTSIPEARRQYDNMQQSFLSGGATKYNWDQFDPKNYF